MSEVNSPVENVVEEPVPNEVQQIGQSEEPKKSGSADSAQLVSETSENVSADQNTEATKDDGSETDDTEPQEDAWIGRRLERAKQKEREKAAAEIEYWKKAAMGQTPVSPQGTQQFQQPQPVAEPKLEQFETIESYTAAYTKWAISETLKQQQAQNTQQQVMSSYAQKAQEYAAKNPKFVAEVQDFIDEYQGSSFNELQQVAYESAVGPQLVHHLAKNRSEVERILTLPSHRRLIELGKLEDRLAGATATAKPKVVVTPKPVSPINGSAPVAQKSIYEMTPEELIMHRNKEKRYR